MIVFHDFAIYHCNASFNRVNKLFKLFVFIIYFATNSFAAIPIFTSQALSIVQIEGLPIILDCNVTSKPLSAINWFKNGNPLDQNNDIIISSFGINQSSRLTIYNSSITDQGLYQCNATNSVGSAIVNAANITIYSK